MTDVFFFKGVETINLLELPWVTLDMTLKLDMDGPEEYIAALGDFNAMWV